MRTRKPMRTPPGASVTPSSATTRTTSKLTSHGGRWSGCAQPLPVTIQRPSRRLWVHDDRYVVFEGKRSRRADLPVRITGADGRAFHVLRDDDSDTLEA